VRRVGCCGSCGWRTAGGRSACRVWRGEVPVTSPWFARPGSVVLRVAGSGSQRRCCPFRITTGCRTWSGLRPAGRRFDRPGAFRAAGAATVGLTWGRWVWHVVSCWSVCRAAADRVTGSSPSRWRVRGVCRDVVCASRRCDVSDWSAARPHLWAVGVRWVAPRCFGVTSGLC